MSDRERTEQEVFWEGAFGEDYIGRNQGDRLLASNLEFFGKALRQAGPLTSCVEFGANIGMNLKALRLLYPGLDATGIEINKTAAAQLGETLGPEKVVNTSIIDWRPTGLFDLALIKGVLIHINPGLLPRVYDHLHAATSRFLLVAEYYNRTPVTIGYRGHEDRLFKRDFAGELLDRFADLTLVDYGFRYHRDPAFPQDDVTWFLMRKSS